MGTTETDLELLEEYLDGAMEAVAASRLQDRFKHEADLASALLELKSQRAVRTTVWQTIEPSEIDAQQMVWRVRGAMLSARTEQSMTEQSMTEQSMPASSPAIRPWVNWWNQWQLSRVGSAAAACLVLGFFLGRVGHNPAVLPSRPSEARTNIASDGADSNTIAVNDINPPPASTPAGSKIMVPITNEYGKVVAWQSFDNPDQAKNFTEDFHSTRAESAPTAPAGPTRLIDDQQQIPF